MQFWAGCVLVCFLAHTVFAQSGDGDVLSVRGSTAQPATCRASPHVVMGAELQWQLSTTGEIVNGSDCNFTRHDSMQDPFQLLDSSGLVAALPGDYSYQCPNIEAGNMTVIKGQYVVALCRECNEIMTEYTLNQGDVLHWSLLRAQGERVIQNINCSSEVWVNGQRISAQGVRSHQFTSPGSYQITCQRGTELQATIKVVGPAQPSSHLLPFLYAHAAIMFAAFGVLLPLGAFLAHNKAKLAHKITQPLGIALALIGFILVLVYVSLTHGMHFRRLIHSVVGLVLLILATIGMPLLLLKKPKTWHKKLGQVVVFFGLGNILLGLSVLSVTPVVAYVLCALYGIWLVIIIMGYVFIPRSNKKVSSYSLPNQEMEETGFNKSHNSSFSSLKGPQRLEKNIISEDKMVQLRKKSIDFFEATRTREQLDLEFINHPLYNKSFENGQYHGEERRGSKPDQESATESDELETSRVPLCSMISQQDSSIPPTPDDQLGTNEKVRMFLASSGQSGPRSQSIDELDEGQSTDEVEILETTKLGRAQTFNHHHTQLEDVEIERGGSLRITRHSQRARKGMDNVFPETLASEVNTEQKVETLPAHVAPPAETSGRRRKGGFIAPPPIITTTSVENPHGAIGCPFHNGNAGLGPPNSRGISPSPSGDSTFESSPRPQRKKKVSVAQIEATVVPSTPVNLLAPGGGSLPRSISHDTLRTHQDMFTDNAFRSVMQISQDAIVCANSVGDIVFWSSGASRMFGYTPGEAIGSNLEMIVPLNYREKHRSGLAKRTGDSLKYLRKHSYAPEEQKHARLYEVRALTKSGHEIPAEVHVTSFVIEGELFYTGVITEMTRKTGGSIGSTSDINELSLKQRAMAVGAQMKIAHNLMNANHISKKELEKVLVSSLRANDFEVEPYQIEQMIGGIMKEGDPQSTGVISFVNLIKLLSKHQLYISESGNIARYGKTIGTQGGDLSRTERITSRTKEFFISSSTTLFWLLLYLILNSFVFAVGLGVAPQQGVGRFAYGAGPVLSMNTVIVLIPTLSSVVTGLRNSVWMNKYLPLTKTTLLHVLVSCAILVWSLIHITLHFVSFAIDTDNTTALLSTTERFTINLRANLFPTITGLIALSLFLLLGLSAVGPLRRMLRFILFYVTHWIYLILFYLVLLVHGVDYFNYSYWKWLLPFVILVVAERIYRYTALPRHSVKVKCAGRYDDQSRTAIIELERPAKFKFEPGQYVILNLPWIGRFNWQPCQISSGPKDKKLTIHIPNSTEPWMVQTFKYFKAHPYHMPKSANHKKDAKSKNKEEVTIETTEENHPADLTNIKLAGPFGPTYHSQLLFDYKISTLVCAGDSGPHSAKAVIKKFLEYRKGTSCHCGCTPALTKLYFVWVVPSGHDFEWFTDYLSELCEDEHVHRYLDVRVFLTNINSPPDELASALLQLGLKTAGPQLIVRRPSQPQLNNLHSKTSYGVPDFPALLDYISAQNAAEWSEGATEFGVFTVGALHHTMRRDLAKACLTSSKQGQLQYINHHMYT